MTFLQLLSHLDTDNAFGKLPSKLVLDTFFSQLGSPNRRTEFSVQSLFVNLETLLYGHDEKRQRVLSCIRRLECILPPEMVYGLLWILVIQAQAPQMTPVNPFAANSSLDSTANSSFFGSTLDSLQKLSWTALPVSNYSLLEFVSPCRDDGRAFTNDSTLTHEVPDSRDDLWSTRLELNDGSSKVG